VLASANEHKAHELAALLPGWELDSLGGATFPEETGESYYANALAKARFGRGLAPPGAWVLGDDSGIEVEALAGAPGVRTRRYAGEHATDDDNNRKLLAALAGLPPERRTARYVCVLALALPSDAGARGGLRVRMRRGIVNGRIATEPRGTNGFGYDPIFEPDSEPSGGRTFGLWSTEEKHAVSHRARAARRMRPLLESLGFG
jgi:XTP/dITP diphosphohydrolase